MSFFAIPLIPFFSNICLYYIRNLLFRKVDIYIPTILYSYYIDFCKIFLFSFHRVAAQEICLSGRQIFAPPLGTSLIRVKQGTYLIWLKDWFLQPPQPIYSIKPPLKLQVKSGSWNSPKNFLKKMKKVLAFWKKVLYTNEVGWGKQFKRQKQMNMASWSRG